MTDAPELIDDVVELLHTALVAMEDGQITEAEAEQMLSCGGAVVAGVRPPADLVRLAIAFGLEVAKLAEEILHPHPERRLERMGRRVIGVAHRCDNPAAAMRAMAMRLLEEADRLESV